MKNACRLVLLMFTLSPLSSNAQESGVISTNLMSFLNIYNPYISLEYNQYLSDKWRINTMGGYILNFDTWSGGNAETQKDLKRHNAKGFRIAIEPQFTFKEIHTNSSKGYLYFGLESYFSHHNYISQRLIKSNQDPFRRYKVRTNVFGLNLLFGSLLFANDRINMTINSGFGVRFLTVKNDLEIPVKDLSPEFRLSSFLEPEENGKHIRFAFPINVKVGFGLF